MTVQSVALAQLEGPRACAAEWVERNEGSGYKSQSWDPWVYASGKKVVSWGLIVLYQIFFWLSVWKGVHWQNFEPFFDGSCGSHRKWKWVIGGKIRIECIMWTERVKTGQGHSRMELFATMVRGGKIRIYSINLKRFPQNSKLLGYYV